MKRLYIFALSLTQLNFGAASSSTSEKPKVQPARPCLITNFREESSQPASSTPIMESKADSGADKKKSHPRAHQSAFFNEHPNKIAYKKYLEIKHDYLALKYDHADEESERSPKQMKEALNQLRDKKTAARIEAGILPDTREYCDLKYAEYLIAQEINAEHKRKLSEIEQQNLSSRVRRFAHGALSYLYLPLWVFNPKGINIELSALLHEKIENTKNVCNLTEQRIDPEEYLKRLEAETYQASEKLNKLRAKKEMLYKRHRLLLKHNFPEQSIRNAQVQCMEIDSEFQTAYQEAQTKGKELEKAIELVRNRSATSGSISEQNRSKSIFSKNHLPGTSEHHYQTTIKFLGAFNLLQTIQDDHSLLQEEIDRRACLSRICGSHAVIKAQEQLVGLTKTVVQKNRLAMKAAKESLLYPEISEPFKSDFYLQTNFLQDTINLFFHPILHGHAEQIPEGTLEKVLKALEKGLELFQKNKRTKAIKAVFSDLIDTANPKALTDLVIEGLNIYIARTYSSTAALTARKTLEKAARYIPIPTPDKQVQGSSSDQAMRDIKDNKKPTLLRSWHPESECPQGIEHCPRLGRYSKMILTAMSTFIHRIKKYESEKRLPYFQDPRDIHHILTILNTTISNIYDTNIKSALNNQACDDKRLKNTLSIVEFLSRLPITFYNINEKLNENLAEIDRLFKEYTHDVRYAFFSWFRVLKTKSAQPHDSHTNKQTNKQSGINFVLVGPTGVGKSHIAREACRLLGITVIEMTLKDLLASSSRKQSVQELLESGSLTPLENELSNLKKESSSLLILIYVDEASPDHGITDSDLKRHLCQFKELFLPSLRIHLPTHLNLVMTCNRTSFLQNDPAVADRFIVLSFDELTPEAKIDRLLPKVTELLQSNALLKDTSKDLDFKKITTEYVHFDPSLNMRLLESRLYCIADYFTQKHEKDAGNWHLFAPEDRNTGQITFQEFLARTFKTSLTRNSKILTIEQKIDALLPKLIACVKNNPKHNPETFFLYNQITTDYVQFEPTLDIETLKEKIPYLADFLLTNAHPSKEDFLAFFAQLFGKADQNVVNQEGDEHASISAKAGTNSSPERSDEQHDSALESNHEQSSSDDNITDDTSTASSSDHHVSSSSSNDSYNDYDTE